MENEILQQILSKLAKLEQGQQQTNQRFDKLEQQTNQRFDKLEQHMLKTEIMIENTIIPQIQLLAEGHTIIQRQIKRLSVIDAIQDDVATLKTAVKFLSNELENLKKAI